MPTFVFRNGQMIDVRDLDPVEECKRSALSAPRIISDTMTPIRSMADGRFYDSRSAYTRGVHATGARIVGNDSLQTTKTSLPRAGRDIKRSIDQLKSQSNR